MAGGGVINSDAAAELLQLAESLQAGVCHHPDGRGGDPHGPSAIPGDAGDHGTVAANRAVTECDLLITIGARLMTG